MNVEELISKEFEKLKKELFSEIKLLLTAEPPKAEVTKWIKGRDAKKQLNCSDSTLQRLRITGELQHKKIGGSYYYLINC
jgi:DNA polymerase III delta subunit